MLVIKLIQSVVDHCVSDFFYLQVKVVLAVLILQLPSPNESMPSCIVVGECFYLLTYFDDSMIN